MAQLAESAWTEIANGGDTISRAEQAPPLAVPWQIWVVVVLLGLEGISNLLMILQYPIALFWLLAKCVFITGLIKGWRWVFVLFLIMAGMHVIGFLSINAMASLMNLLLMALVVSARAYFFPPRTPRDRIEDHASLAKRVAELEAQLRAMKQA